MKKLGMSSLTFCLITSIWQVSAAATVEIKGPNDRIRFDLISGEGHLAYAIGMADRPVIAQSPLGIVVDGVDLGRFAQLGEVESYGFEETYATRGVHSRAVNHFKGARVRARHAETKADFTIDIRVFDDGAAFRIIVPDAGRERVPDEATAFRLVAGEHGLVPQPPRALRGSPREEARRRGEGRRVGRASADGQAARMVLATRRSRRRSSAVSPAWPSRPTATSDFAARLGHAHPASYPFTLRYKDDVERLSRPAISKGALTSPWRVVMVGADLNTLVNCDIVQSVSPPPDPVLFPKGLDTGWVKPGRAVWKFLDGGENSLAGMKEFSQLAGELGFEYNVIEGFWQRWTDDQLRELVDDSKAHGVGIWLWKHSKDLRTPEARRAFFQRCKDAGAVGAKIDFFDHEAKEVVDLYPLLLREAADSPAHGRLPRGQQAHGRVAYMA